MKLEYPKKVSEFEIQAEAYNKLKGAGFNVRGEVRLKQKGQRGARFDLVVFDSNNFPLFVIEVKKSLRRKMPKQLIRYEILSGLPCLLIRGLREAQTITKLIREQIEDRICSPS